MDFLETSKIPAPYQTDGIVRRRMNKGFHHSASRVAIITLVEQLGWIFNKSRSLPSNVTGVNLTWHTKLKTRDFLRWSIHMYSFDSRPSTTNDSTARMTIEWHVGSQVATCGAACGRAILISP